MLVSNNTCAETETAEKEKKMETKKANLSTVIASINTIDDETLASVIAIVKEYASTRDFGKYGNMFETIVNAVITATASHRKPANINDVVTLASVKPYSIECKTACGMLVSGLDEQTAKSMLNDVDSIIKAVNNKYVCYVPLFRKPSHIYDARVLYTKTFIELLAKYRLLRVKKQSNGQFAIAIQNYLPTKSFAGLRRGLDFVDELNHYQNLAKFAKKFAVKA